MHCVGNELMLLLILTALHVHCRTVLKTHNRNETDILLSLKREAWIECDCGPVGHCSFVNGDKQCSCPRAYAEKDGKCEEICAVNDDCIDYQKCVEKEDGWKKCECADGRSGPNCETMTWCEDTEKFINCKGSNGTCEYNVDERAVVCTCNSDKQFYTGEMRCRETCLDDIECKNEGRCEKKGEYKFCSCKLGLIGDKCETAFDCTTDGKYKDCESSGGKCVFDGSKAVCECSGSKKFHDTDNMCKECICGPKEICSFESGDKMCKCMPGTAVKEGKCTETCSEDTDCHNEGKCEADGENKVCSCKSGLTGDKCETVFDCSSEGMYKECEISGGTCFFDGSKAVCECPGNKRLHDVEKICKVDIRLVRFVFLSENGVGICLGKFLPSYMENMDLCFRMGRAPSA
ncbi:hypothetical protein AVEN_7514-1 [Araneus ventricosus]|uniref:EGF-like domain-containing protein n=1 Tax=Araneus ventricosus TaxID=182803 RepID=A0A4Y2NEL8_ARAVE|nr:hypothetical protein AVEN_7514-1 [Araneus ventricosus]